MWNVVVVLVSDLHPVGANIHEPGNDENDPCVQVPWNLYCGDLDIITLPCNLHCAPVVVNEHRHVCCG